MPSIPPAKVVVDHHDFLADFTRKRKRRAVIALLVGFVVVGLGVGLWLLLPISLSYSPSDSLAENRETVTVGFVMMALKGLQWVMLTLGTLLCIAALAIYITVHRGVRPGDDID